MFKLSKFSRYTHTHTYTETFNKYFWLGTKPESYTCAIVGQVRTNKSDNPIWRPQSWKETKLDLKRDKSDRENSALQRLPEVTFWVSKWRNF